jgi:DNA polymerase
MDVDVWARRDLAPVSALSQPAPPTAFAGNTSAPIEVMNHSAMKAEPSHREPVNTSPVESSRVESLSWDELATQVRGCTLCALSETRTQTVFGVGNQQAEWMIIGEAPGAEEDRQGEPFVGRAGQLLNSMLQAMGFPREQVFIANVLKCRPPANRDPKPEEAACCAPYLARQIELVNPRVILCVGRIAAQNLLATSEPIGKLRGRVHQLGGKQRPVVVTYHPAYLLRSPGEKRKAWDDLQLALRTYAATPSRSA